MFGACFHGLFGFPELGEAVFAALDFLGDGEAVLERGAVGILGFLEELGDLLFGELHLFDGVAVAHGTVFAGVGEDLGAVDGDGDVAELEDPGTKQKDSPFVEIFLAICWVACSVRA